MIKQGVAEKRLWQFLVVYIAMGLVWGMTWYAQTCFEPEYEKAKEVASKVERKVSAERDAVERPVRRAVEFISWREEPSFFSQWIEPQLCYPFFITIIVFFIGKRTAKKAQMDSDDAGWLLFVSAGLALMGAFSFLASEREEGILIVSGFLIASSGLLAGMAYSLRKERKWLSAVAPFAALVFEFLLLAGKAKSFWSALA